MLMVLSDDGYIFGYFLEVGGLDIEGVGLLFYGCLFLFSGRDFSRWGDTSGKYLFP